MKEEGREFAKRSHFEASSSDQPPNVVWWDGARPDMGKLEAKCPGGGAGGAARDRRPIKRLVTEGVNPGLGAKTISLFSLS